MSSLRRGDVLRAARCAGWLVFVLMNSGEFARGGGWLARARRLLDDGQHDCVERGHLLVPAAFQHAFAGDWPTAHAISGQAAEIGDRFGDIGPGDARPQHSGPGADRAGKTGEGMTLLDEVMVAVMAGRGVRDRRRRRLLQRDRGVPGGLRSAPGAAVDGGADPLVRLPAGPGPVQRPLPRASRRDHAAARRVAGRHRRGAAGVRAAPPAGSAGGRCRLLPAGRAAPAARRVRRGRGGVPPGQPVGTRAAARSGAAAAGPGAGRRRRGGDPPRGRTRRRTAWRGRGCFPRYVEIMLAAGDVAAARAAADELSQIADDLDAPLLRAAGRPGPGSRPAARGRRPSRAAARCAGRGRRGRSSRCRTRPLGSGS